MRVTKYSGRCATQNPKLTGEFILTLMLIKLFHFSLLRLFVVWSKSISKSTTGLDVMRLTGSAETSHNETLGGGKINHTVNSNALLFSWLLQRGT